MGSWVVAGAPKQGTSVFLNPGLHQLIYPPQQECTLENKVLSKDASLRPLGATPQTKHWHLRAFILGLTTQHHKRLVTILNYSGSGVDK